MPGPIRLRSSASTFSSVGARLGRVGAAHHQLDVVDRVRGAEVQRRPLDAAQDPGQAVVDVRLAHPVEVPGPDGRRRPARSASRRASRGITSSVNIFSISRGTPGRKYASAPPRRTTNPGAMPGRVRQRLGAVRDAHLAQVVGRHLEAVRREPLLHRLQRRLVGVVPVDQQLGHDVDRPVVLRRPEAAGGDDDVHLGPQPDQRRPDRLRIVRHHHLLRQLVARPRTAARR